MAIIRMRDHLYDEIVNYAKEHLPEEACGLLAGVETEEGREIQKVYFLENKDHAEDHFTLDPRDQMNAIKDMRANGLKPLGNWHSHPSSPSRPSVEDIRLAFDSKASYLILSLMAEYPVLNSFHVESGVWEKEDHDVMTEVMRVLEEKYSYPVDIEYACNFDQDGNYRVNLLQCRPLQTRGVGAAGVMPNVKEFYFRTSGNFMGGNVCLPIRYAVMVQVEPYLDLPEQRKYQVARKLGELNNLLRDEGTILLGPGRWGTTIPSLGVPVHFMEINRFDCIAELAYSSHGLRPELSYGSHFFQDLVEAGSFYVALYPGEDGCVFQDALFADCENVYAQLMPSDTEDGMADVIRVYDLGRDQAILYSEVGSQACFLAKV